MRYQFVDCRWELGAPGRGGELYLAGHIPGASFLDVDEDLSAPAGPGGRHPLPAPEDFARVASQAGIGTGIFVVAYGNMGGAERLWWLLRHFGHGDCAVLELDGWLGPLRAGEEEIEPGDFRPRPRDSDTVSPEELARRLEELVIVDARRPERFRGDPNPIDKVPGRIPGALNALAGARDAEHRRPPPALAHRTGGQALPRLLERVGAARAARHWRLNVTVTLACTCWVPGSIGVRAPSAAAKTPMGMG